MHEFIWRSWQAIRSIEIQRLRGVATTARALCDVHVTVLTVVATAVVSDRMRSRIKKLPRIISAHHSGCHKPLGIRRTTRDGTNRDTPTCILLPSISCDSDWVLYTHCAVLRCAALYLSGATCNDSVIVLLFRLVQLPPPRRRTQVRLKFSIFFANPIVESDSQSNYNRSRNDVSAHEQERKQQQVLHITRTATRSNCTRLALTCVYRTRTASSTSSSTTSSSASTPPDSGCTRRM
jgi:hypothetical protein